MAITPVLLSGGSGTRLWPLSRADFPKQLHALVQDITMLQSTALRANGKCGVLDFAAPVVVAGETHRFEIIDQLAGVAIEPQAIILEPDGRNTAPALGLAAHAMIATGMPDALLLVMPSDHVIADMAAFHAAILAAVPAARAGRLVTFGVMPSSPATGYGYIAPVRGSDPVQDVARFVEKPDRATAERHVADGYLWNAGIFLMQAQAFVDALSRHAPEVALAVSCASQGGSVDGIFHRPDSAAFAACPAISIDYAVLERAANVSVVPVDMGWSDVGSWDALWHVSGADGEGNVARGECAAIATRNSFLRNDGGPLLVAFGVEDMVVVSTADAVLVAPRDRAEDLRLVVDQIAARGTGLTRVSHEVRRPWGSYRSLDQAKGWQVKRITVKPGGRLSLQKHARRAETWVVASGEALVHIGERQARLEPGQSCHIAIGEVHRLDNPGPAMLELIEVQHGAYLGEDDIVRLSDIYGRDSAT